MSPRSTLLLFVFGISGACGLGYELVWMRLLTGLFGVSLHATSMVIAVFMAGLGLGSAWLAPRLELQRTPLALYALLEIGIGAWAFFLPQLVALVRLPYVTLLGWVDHATPAVIIVRVAVTLLLVGPPAALMGATLPVFVRALSARSGSAARAARGAALAYGANTLGAVLGTLVAGIYLVRFWGVERANATLAAINLAIGLGVSLIVRRDVGEGGIRSVRRLPRWTALGPLGLCAALAGAGMLALEVAWMRVLSVLTYDTVFATTSTLAGFLVGIGAGSFALGIWWRRLTAPWTVLSMLQLGVAAYACASPEILSWLAEVAGWRALGGAGEASSLAPDQARQLLLSFGFFALPTLLSGASLALVFRLGAKLAQDHGIGPLYAANSAGALCGALIAGVLAVPLLGSRATIGLGAAACAGAALVAISRPVRAQRDGRNHDSRRENRGGSAAIKGAFALAVALALWSFSLDRHALFGKPDPERGQVVFAAEDEGALVEVVEKAGVRTLFTDRRNAWGSTHPLMLEGMLEQGLLPLLLRDSPRAVVDVGVATGVSFVPLLADDGVRRAEIVEISLAVARAARLFADHNARFYDDPRVELVVADGRNHLLVSPHRYDLIVLGLFTPYSAGAGYLYSQDLYRVCREHLAAGGLLVQWLPLDQLTQDALKSIVASFASVFEHAHAFERFQYLALVASRERLVLDPDAIAARLARPGLGAIAERAGLDSVQAVLARYALGPHELRALAGGAPFNTDDRLVVEFSSPDARERGSYAQASRNLELLHRHRAPLVPLPQAAQSAWQVRVDAARAGRVALVRGVIADARGDQADALQHFLEALRVTPQDPLARAMVMRASRAQP